MTSPERVTLTPDTQEAPRVALGRLEVKRGPGAAALPLAAVGVRARVAGDIAEIVVEQTFQNPYPDLIEAVYIFPLPGDAAVSAFEMRVGDRVVRGVVQEKRQARAAYDAALAEGRQASLLEQERDDIFTLQVGNLPPGQAVTVRITLAQTLPVYPDGVRELRLPLVVAPRYIPGEPLERAPLGHGIEDDTDRVRDASRITPPRLVEGFDPGVALTLEVELREPALRNLTCSQHATRTTLADGGLVVALADPHELMNRDFVLRWQAAQAPLVPELLLHRAADGTFYGLLGVTAPADEGRAAAPRDVVFVLDRSGSMDGLKAVSAARAAEMLLGTLGPDDRFAIEAFGSTVAWWPGDEGQRLRPAEPGALARGAHYLRTAPGLGGTEMLPALEQALALLAKPGSAGRQRLVVFITDGQVGNEAELLKRVRAVRGEARILALGVDTAVNEAFLARLARDNGGVCRCVQPGGAVEEALREMARALAEPVITGLSVVDEAGALVADGVAPTALPDLYPGRLVRVGVRLTREAPLTLAGRHADGRAWSATARPRVVKLPALAHAWARRRLVDLEDALAADAMAGATRDAREAEIVALACRHTLLSRLTSFVAVDERVVVEPNGERRTVVQPVEMPAAWEMPVAMAAPGQALPVIRKIRSESFDLGAALGASSAWQNDSFSAFDAPVPEASSPLAEVVRKTRAAVGAFRKRIPAGRRAQEQPLETLLAELCRVLDDLRRDLDAGLVPTVSGLKDLAVRLGAVRGVVTRKEMRAPFGRLLDPGIRTLIAALEAAEPTAALRPRIDALQTDARRLIDALHAGWVA